MRHPTDRQQEVLDWIRSHIRRYSVPPTRTEIAHGLGLSEASSVAGHLTALARFGRIEILRGKNRGIRILDDEIPLIGALAEVAAGTPIVCDAHTVERVPRAIAEQFRPRPDYLLTVRGDSMERVVQDGDIVAVQRTPEAKTGQIVVARFGDDVTLKRFARIDDRHVELRPESHNTTHAVMEIDLAKHILVIEGVAVGALIRGLDNTESTQETRSNHVALTNPGAPDPPQETVRRKQTRPTDGGPVSRACRAS